MNYGKGQISIQEKIIFCFIKYFDSGKRYSRRFEAYNVFGYYIGHAVHKDKF